MMNRIGLIALVSSLLLCLGPGRSQAFFHSKTFSSTRKSIVTVDCGGLKLNQAAGVPHSKEHQYDLRGVCRRISTLLVDGKKKSSKEIGRAFAKVSAEWDARNSMAVESVKLEGGATGTVDSTFKCASDPWITKTSCTVVNHANSTGWDDISRPVML